MLLSSPCHLYIITVHYINHSPAGSVSHIASTDSVEYLRSACQHLIMAALSKHFLSTLPTHFVAAPLYSRASQWVSFLCFLWLCWLDFTLPVFSGLYLLTWGGAFIIQRMLFWKCPPLCNLQKARHYLITDAVTSVVYCVHPNWRQDFVYYRVQ